MLSSGTEAGCGVADTDEGRERGAEAASTELYGKEYPLGDLSLGIAPVVDGPAEDVAEDEVADPRPANDGFALETLFETVVEEAGTATGIGTPSPLGESGDVVTMDAVPAA